MEKVGFVGKMAADSDFWENFETCEKILLNIGFQKWKRQWILLILPFYSYKKIIWYNLFISYILNVKFLRKGWLVMSDDLYSVKTKLKIYWNIGLSVWIFIEIERTNQEEFIAAFIFEIRCLEVFIINYHSFPYLCNAPAIEAAYWL